MTEGAWRIERFDELDSTNTKARELAQRGFPDRTLVIARMQSAGRGRQGRSWRSLPGNLLCTALWRPHESWPPISTFPLVIALAAKATIDRMAGQDISTVKWPNDILVGGRKICGMLIETGVEVAGQRWLIAGIGINVVAHPTDDPDLAATSLQGEGLFGPDANAVCDCLLEEFDRIVPEWRVGGFEAVRDRYLAAVGGVGGIIRVRSATDGAADLQGKFVDIAEDGRLMLQTHEKLHFISAGDVFGVDQ